MRFKTAIFLISAFVMLASPFAVAGKVAAITPMSDRRLDVAATSLKMVPNSNASDPPFPWVGVNVNVYPHARSVQYVNSSDYFYVAHGFGSPDNWSSLTLDAQNAFLDPQQTYFTLETNASNFQNPPLIQFTYYDSGADVMYSMFWFQFHPGDLAPGAYSFTGTWSSVAAANPPNYTAIYSQNTITLVVIFSPPPVLVFCSSNPVSIGQPTTCTVTVSGPNPTGMVTWSTSSIGGSFSQSVCPLSNGSCSTTYVDNFTGSVTIAAYYGGDSNNVPSSGRTILTVTSGGPVYYSENYASVQAAIDAAPPGATVIVAAGFYSQSLTVDKMLTIIGEKDPPVFSGGASGIYLTLLSGASGSIVTGIEITNFDKGIVVVNASNCRIYSNIMASLGSSGIVLEGSNATDNTIFNNIFQNTPTPVNLTASAGNNTIYNNIISSQATLTLNIGANGNNVFGNSISGSQVLLNMTNSHGNNFYHNNFLAAVQLTVLGGGNNIWDNGYPSGGNYWSNYAGADVKSGSAQNLPGSDGIGDTPYIIDSSNTDRYPLMKPWPLASGHCVAVMSVLTAKTVIGQGFNCSMSVNVVNRGEYRETFSVAAYANATSLATQQIDNLNATCQTVLVFTWNTASLAYGNYAVGAYAQPVAGQTDVSGSDFTLGLMKVTIPGDIDGNFRVQLSDLVLLAQAYGSRPGVSNWNPNADIDSNGIVGLSDLVILAQHYGQHYP